MKTVLNKAIALMKVFPHVEHQTFYVISPRKVLVHSKMQMQKVFYSDHYYIDVMWTIEENVYNDENGNQKQSTLIEFKTALKFVKTVNMVQKKIQEYYDTTLMSSFDYYLKPRLE